MSAVRRLISKLMDLQSPPPSREEEAADYTQQNLVPLLDKKRRGEPLTEEEQAFLDSGSDFSRATSAGKDPWETPYGQNATTTSRLRKKMSEED